MCGTLYISEAHVNIRGQGGGGIEFASAPVPSTLQICPFMIYGELVQRWRVASGTTLLKWPREMGEALGGG